MGGPGRGVQSEVRRRDRVGVRRWGVEASGVRGWSVGVRGNGRALGGSRGRSPLASKRAAED